MTTIERLAEASELSAAEVEAKMADGLIFYRDSDYFGGVQPPGEWLDGSGTEFVVTGPTRGYGFAWGKGATVEAAKVEHRKNGGVLGRGYIVVEFGPGSAFVGIGGMGYRWVGEQPTVTEVPPRGKA